MGYKNCACKLGSYKAYCDMEKEWKSKGSNSISSLPSKHDPNQNNSDNDSHTSLRLLTDYQMGFKKEKGLSEAISYSEDYGSPDKSFLLSGVCRSLSGGRQDMKRIHIKVHIPKAFRTIRNDQLPSTENIYTKQQKCATYHQ